MIRATKTAITVFDDSKEVLNEKGEKCFMAHAENNPDDKYPVSHVFRELNYQEIANNPYDAMVDEQADLIEKVEAYDKYLESPEYAAEIKKPNSIAKIVPAMACILNAYVHLMDLSLDNADDEDKAEFK